MSIKSRMADDYADSRHSSRERAADTHRANLELRNKAFDYMMEDGDTRRFMIDTAKDSYQMGKTILKIGGIAILSAAGVYLIYRMGGSLMDKWQQGQRSNAYTEGHQASNNTYKDIDYQNWADSLYRNGFNQEGSWWQVGVVSYDDALIRDILTKLKNSDDWKALYKAFGFKEVRRGTGEGEQHDLVWYLSQDTSGYITKADYQKIIEKLNVNIQL